MFNNKTYRIDDVDFRLTPNSILERPDGSTLTYLEYYKEVWQQNIQDQRQPLLVNRPKKRQQRRAAGSDVNYLIPGKTNLRSPGFFFCKLGHQLLFFIVLGIFRLSSRAIFFCCS